MNSDGSFSITSVAREILWSVNIPVWAKILRLLQIKSSSAEQISNILRITKNQYFDDLEKLRKNGFILMSPQRIDEKIIKIYEIQPEGIEKIDRTDKEGFKSISVEELKPEIEILSKIDEIIKEIKDSQMEQLKKDSVIKKLSQLKNKLEI